MTPGNANGRATTRSIVFGLSALLSFLFPATAPAAANTDCDTPYYANWNSGIVKDGYGPDYQLELIADGHRVAPWFGLPAPGESLSLAYYKTAIEAYRKKNLPLTFVSTQWERLLSEQPYRSIGDDSNPNVLPLVGTAEKRLSPFGDEKYWYQVGYQWTSRPVVAQLQELYPNPPLVIFLSNNEHPKLPWYQIELDKRYSARYAVVQNLLNGETKRDIAVAGWKKLYTALHKGMRDGLKNETWKRNARFVGYLANGSPTFGKSPTWEFETLFTENSLDPYASYWDGSSYSYYSNTNSAVVQSPQVEAMNWVFLINANKAANPNYFVDLSLWDGHTYDQSDWRAAQESKERGSSLQTYIAMAKWGAWLVRPAIMREFRFYNETVANNQQYTQGILNIVDEINQNPILKRFWCEGSLVPNRSRQHPYNSNIPAKYANVDRWYLLNTSFDQPGNWNLKTPILVYALALKIGETPRRQWLLYAYSTDKGARTVEVEIPDYRKIRLSTSASGTYFIVQEPSDQAQEITDLPMAPSGFSVLKSAAVLRPEH